MYRIEDEVKNMGRPKGGKNRKWTQEEKLEVVQRYLASGIGQHSYAKAEGISSGMLFRWLKQYQESGFDGLASKRRGGNPYAALTTSKSLSELERLRLTVAKQEAEITRLKNGYQVRGGGVSKEYVTLSGVSIKSSKK